MFVISGSPSGFERYKAVSIVCLRAPVLWDVDRMLRRVDRPADGIRWSTAGTLNVGTWAVTGDAWA